MTRHADPQSESFECQKENLAIWSSMLQEVHRTSYERGIVDLQGRSGEYDGSSTKRLRSYPS